MSQTAPHSAAPPHIHTLAWRARHDVYLAQQRLERAEHAERCARIVTERAQYELARAKDRAASAEQGIIA